MGFSARVFVVAVLAFLALPAAALAGSDDKSTKKEERQAKLQADVDAFVGCLRTQNIVLDDIDVASLENVRKVAHRGRGFGLRRGWFGFRGGTGSKVARIVSREASLDRTDESVRSALQTCREEQRDARLAALQLQADELATCLQGKEGLESVETIDVSERPRLARRGSIGRLARIMAREADLDRGDDAIRDAIKDCRSSVKAAASA